MATSDEREQLEQRIAAAVQEALSGLRRELDESLERSGQALKTRIETLETEWPASFLERADLSSVADRAERASRGKALADLRASFAAIDEAASQREILDALLREAGRYGSRALLVLTREDGVRGWAGRGFGSDDQVGSLSFDDSPEGTWSGLKEAGGVSMLSDEERGALADRLGSAAAAEAALIPMILRDRLAAALYVDRMEEGGAFDLPALQMLTYVAAQALELLAFRERDRTPTLHVAGGTTAASSLPVWSGGGEAAQAAPEAEAEEATSADTASPDPHRADPSPVAFSSEPSAVTAEAPSEPAPAADTPAAVPPAPSSYSPSPEPAPSFEDDSAELSVSEVEAFEAPSFEPEEPAVEVPSFEVPSYEAPSYDPDGDVEMEAEADSPAGAEELTFSEEPLDFDTGGEAGPEIELEEADASGFDLSDAPELSASGLGSSEYGAFSAESAPAEVEAPAEQEGGWGAQSLSPLPEDILEAPEDPPPPSTSSVPSQAPPSYLGGAGAEPPPASEPSAPPSVPNLDVSEDATVMLPRIQEGAATAPPPPPVVPTPPPAAAESVSGAPEVKPPSGFEGPGLAFSGSSSTPAAPGAAPPTDAPPAGEGSPVHEEGRRLARLLVSEIRLYNEEEVEEGRENRDIYRRLRDEIERSRKMYEERTAREVRESRDYFTEELVRILADGDAGALGM